MGKSRTNIFSRRRKESDNVIKENDADKKRRSIDTSNVENVSMSVDAKGEKKKPRDSRKTVGKQKAENNRSLKRMKKRGVVLQMFEKIPKEVRKSTKNAKAEKVEEESEYDIPSELYPGPSVSPAQKLDEIIDHSDDEGDGEDIYESRKLLIRQMQGLIAKEVHGSCSEYDSWSDLEENFALAYEPIPLNIHMDTW
jgi:hypothetical protein